MSSRFVTSTLNGMFIAQLAAWMTAPGGAAMLNVTPAALPNPALLSQADDNPARGIDDEWQMVYPVPGAQPEARAATNSRHEAGADEAADNPGRP